MEALPNRIVDRVAGSYYLYKGEERHWDGKILRCVHNRRPVTCKDCGGSQICEHGKRKPMCSICGGGGLCRHGKEKLKCKECGSSQFCEHGRLRSYCKDCGGGGLCKHGKRRTLCKDCGGGGLCEHGKPKGDCKHCSTRLYCEHGIRRSFCADCGGGGLCEHGKRRTYCQICGGGATCEHGRKDICKICGGSRICDHGKYINYCMICKPQTAIAHSLRTRINRALKDNTKSGSLIELLGCSIGDFKVYLESMFESEMTWSNHGDWHIDHRRPCASFDLENEEQLFMCFHYTNLQPMWARNNLSKGKIYDEENFDWEWDGSQWVEKA